MHPGTAERIAALARIPEEGRDLFQRLLRMAVREAHRGHGKNRGLPRRRKIINRLEHARRESPSGMLALLGDETAAADAASALLGMVVAPIALEEWIETATGPEKDAAIGKAAILAARMFRSGGAPPGTRGGSAFDLFVFSLLHVTEACGGDFGRVSQHGGDPAKGRFIDALLALKSDLPHDFRPADATILRAVRRAKSNLRELKS